MGRPVPLPAELVAFVGPPILDGFRDVGSMNEAEARDALAIYRSLAASDGPGDDAAVFPGMLGLVRAIHAAGVPLALATSKSETQANRILEHLEIANCFTVICGSSEDETRSAKKDVVEEALRRLREQHIDLSNLVMVGDREHDIEGAGHHGVPAIMVEWGYGSPAEALGAIAVVHSVDQLREKLL
jgi:phosphoglycolate phosphatase